MDQGSAFPRVTDLDMTNDLRLEHETSISTISTFYQSVINRDTRYEPECSRTDHEHETMLDLELDKAHVLVSGANGGIGLVTVKSFLGESHISPHLPVLKHTNDRFAHAL